MKYYFQTGTRTLGSFIRLHRIHLGTLRSCPQWKIQRKFLLDNGASPTILEVVDESIFRQNAEEIKMVIVRGK